MPEPNVPFAPVVICTEFTGPESLPTGAIHLGFQPGLDPSRYAERAAEVLDNGRLAQNDLADLDQAGSSRMILVAVPDPAPGGPNRIARLRYRITCCTRRIYTVEEVPDAGTEPDN